MNTADMTAKRFLTAAEVARAIGVSKMTVARWCEQGKLPAKRAVAGSTWRIDLRVIRERNIGLWEELEEARTNRDEDA